MRPGMLYSHLCPWNGTHLSLRFSQGGRYYQFAGVLSNLIAYPRQIEPDVLEFWPRNLHGLLDLLGANLEPIGPERQFVGMIDSHVV